LPGATVLSFTQQQLSVFHVVNGALQGRLRIEPAGQGLRQCGDGIGERH
jgi:hypothetical protein